MVTDSCTLSRIQPFLRNPKFLRGHENCIHEDSDVGRDRSLFIWSKIDGHLILFIFLPALIYEGSSETNYYVFMNHFWSAQILAFPGMVVQALMIACVARWVLPYSWEWTEAWLFGAILSATDPVAVVALLKELGVLPDLRVLIEAESLLNDGSAIVLFQLCFKILLEPGPYGTAPVLHSSIPWCSQSSETSVLSCSLGLLPCTVPGG
jgi:NhaP-type Na+/H+ or K+/H+ antiporter